VGAKRTYIRQTHHHVLVSPKTFSQVVHKSLCNCKGQSEAKRLYYRQNNTALMEGRRKKERERERTKHLKILKCYIYDRVMTTVILIF
jgi:hypothetical protein